MSEYIINNKTLAILPYSNKYSIIYENNKILVINKKPTNIIKFNCNLYGSSLSGRVKGSNYLLDCRYKNPISINNNLILFPTSSPRLSSCIWINYINIKDINNVINNYSIIHFNNDFKLLLHYSKNIINNQFIKSSLLDFKISKNIGHFS